MTRDKSLRRVDFDLGEGIIEDLEDEQLQSAQGGWGGSWRWGGRGRDRGWGSRRNKGNANAAEVGQPPQLVEQQGVGAAPRPINGRGR